MLTCLLTLANNYFLSMVTPNVSLHLEQFNHLYLDYIIYFNVLGIFVFYCHYIILFLCVIVYLCHISIVVFSVTFLLATRSGVGHVDDMSKTRRDCGQVLIFLGQDEVLVSKMICLRQDEIVVSVMIFLGQDLVLVSEMICLRQDEILVSVIMFLGQCQVLVSEMTCL